MCDPWLLVRYVEGWKFDGKMDSTITCTNGNELLRSKYVSGYGTGDEDRVKSGGGWM